MKTIFKMLINITVNNRVIEQFAYIYGEGIPAVNSITRDYKVKEFNKIDAGVDIYYYTQSADGKTDDTNLWAG